ncbi:F390 synthetase-related protein [Marinisporobacter balticus]|uniref:Putative adenylate-forming enzyme n=1 Tax=Marinisporobacter balticus TaxID=2018667 RepID=A0A4R2KRU5_9FIRM|nr:F390 synthetase-related protein [Marinisporobacter balticus]TCO69355.1 putative adenylate-forming enzyme [Marinisporobacter balticus]
MIEQLKILMTYLKSKYFIRFHSREVLENWQDKKMKNFLKNIVPLSPFYKKYYEGFSYDNWKELPLVDKNRMMEYFDTFNTVGIKKDEAFQIAFQAEKTRDFSPQIHDITIGLSSGTSGNRGIFLASKNERIKWAGTVLAKCLPYSILKEHKIAFFLRANSNLYDTVDKGKIKFHFFDLLDLMDDHIKNLNTYKPSILVAPPSMLSMLAKKIKTGMLKIDPQKVISVAEVLDPLDEKYLSDVFNQKIHQVYQCTEGFLATTCEYGTLHLNEDLLVIQKEYLDKNLGKFIPIISDFSRTSQPIIRYRLNDILTEKKMPCPCGSHFTALEQIEGRCDDLFYFRKKESDTLIPVFPDFIRRVISLSSDEIKQYKVNQVRLDLIEVFLEVSDDRKKNMKKEIEKNLERLCNQFNCLIPKIQYIHKLEEQNGKKLRRVERKFEI